MLQELDLFEPDPSEISESDLARFPTEAVVTSTDWTTETVLSQLRRGNIDLSPHFQRREAWNDSRKSAFIESLFMGLPVPQLVLAERQGKRGSYIVIDGKQRLLSIRRFAVEEDQEDFKPLTLSGLKNRSDLNGQTWPDLRRNLDYQDDVTAYENQTIRTVVVRHWPKDDFLYLLFLRLNTGSLPLSTQELRQALHPGDFTDFVATHSADSHSIQRALNLSAPDFRMRDVELLIRFFAFAESAEVYDGNLKEFLDNTAKRYNEDWHLRRQEIEELARQCDAAIDTTIAIFGQHAFRRWRVTDGFVGRFNRAVFDIMVYYFRHHELRPLAEERGTDVKRAFIELCTKDELFTEALQTTTKSIQATSHRLRRWGETLQSVLGCRIDIPETSAQKRVARL